MSTAISDMDRVTQQNAAMVEETTAGSQKLESETAALAEVVDRFVLGDLPGTERLQAA